MNTTLNASEMAIAGTAPVAGQSPVSAPAVGALRTAVGANDVPNSLISGVLGSLGGGGGGGGGGLGGALGGLAGATPWGAAAGALGAALSSPDPALTTSVSTGANAKYGDNYVSNMAGAAKAGTFNVTSGQGSARSATDTNAENRAQQGAGASSGFPTWGIWAIVGGAGLVVLLLFRRS